jgi:hypothetical protein
VKDWIWILHLLSPCILLFMCYLRSWIVERKSYKGWNLAAPSLHPILVRVWESQKWFERKSAPYFVL